MGSVNDDEWHKFEFFKNTYLMQNTESKYYQNILIIVQIAAVGLFIGRGWQHLYWDAPFRTLLWDENLMSGFVNNWLSMTWEDYVRDPTMDDNIQNLIKGFGVFYLFLAVLSVFIKKVPKPIAGTARFSKLIHFIRPNFLVISL